MKEAQSRSDRWLGRGVASIVFLIALVFACDAVKRGDWAGAVGMLIPAAIAALGFALTIREVTERLEQRMPKEKGEQ